jgi:hypothetical protein
VSAADLAVPYAVVGAVAALVSMVAGGRRSLADALLLLVVWPIYAPFVVTRGSGPTVAGPTGHPLGAVLPDRATLAAVERRLSVAHQRVADIERLLARPELDEGTARARLDRLEAAASSTGATAGARSRLASIERLRALKARFEREIEQVAEVLIELETQAELVRLAGAEDPAMADVLRELGARSESLHLMLAEELPWSPPDPEASDRP